VRRSDGGFALMRRTISKKLLAFLQTVKQALRESLHEGVPVQGKWLGSVVRGYFQYHGIPGNRVALETVRRKINRMWLKHLRRRSQKQTLSWARFARWVKRWIPSSRIVHPYPNERFAF
jgi:RNA-directed DNA polymerase